MPIEDVLPGYRWNARAQRYVSTRTGRFVARQRILDAMESHINGKEAQLGRLTNAVMEGRIAPSVWEIQVRQELKRLHLQNAALGAGGWDQLTPRDFGRVGGRLRSEYRYLARFAQQIEAGEVTQAQALNRLHMYMGNARRQYFEAERDRLQPTKPDTTLIERRLLGVAEHCIDCVNYYEQGWQPAGTLPVPSDRSVCDGNCRCSLIRKEVPISEVNEWIGTKR